MAEETLAPEVLERVCRQIREQHPEMEGAAVEVSRRRADPQAVLAAEKAGLPAVELPVEPQYVVTMRKDARTEDGFVLPMLIRVTVDEQGNLVKKHEAH